MTTETKTFAFKLVKNAARAAKQPWQARAGIAASGCTAEAGDTGDYRADTDVFGNYRGRDLGYFCLNRQRPVSTLTGRWQITIDQR